MMITDGGLSFLLDLPTARLLRHGEALILDDGRKIEVRAEPERLYKISGRDGAHLLALTWQIGNRHLAAQIGLDHVIIRHDPVIRDMLEGLGAVVEEVTAAFNPEGGAYDALPHSHDYGDEGDTEHHHAHG